MLSRFAALLALATLAFPVTACKTVDTPAPAAALPLPAPLQATTVDDKAVAIAFTAFDTLLTTVDALVDVGVIKPGSPKARTIAAALGKARDLLNRASALQRAGSGDPAALFVQAADAIRLVKAQF